MKKNLLFVGIDVDDNSFNVALISKLTGEVFHFKCKPTSGALIKKLETFTEKEFSLKICYESTYLGFSLARDLRKHSLDCEVIASSLIPSISGKKVKTDKIDCLYLAKYFMQGLLTIVSMPNKEDEIDRDILRSRSLLVKQIKGLKVHITALCRRMCLNYKSDMKKSEYWSTCHRVWLTKKINEIDKSDSLKINLNCLVSTLNQMEDSVRYYEQEIERISEKVKYKERKDALIVYRGIKTITAMTIITEIGDINRFTHPKKLVSYLGLDIIEYSSGGKEKKFGITKMGNSRARTALIESNQSSCSPPKVSRVLSRRREGIDPKCIAIADRCMKRLNRKGTKMLHNNKNGNLVKTACAREMVGFIWESLHQIA